MILILFAALLMAFLCRGGFLYGSDTDWISQHSVLPEYLRQRFYQTGNFFPDFAMNLGGGQNIYYLSYYGLFNPIILISYLLPGVSMTAYVMASSIAVVLLSVCLCFRWLKNNGFSSQVTFIATFCFLCAGPLIFQSHRQITFVDYFPFLLLGLLSIDQYFKTHRKWHFILCVFLCILTSYFFSVGCILVLLIYAGYKQVKESPTWNFRSLVRGIFPFIRGVAIAVFMAAILWLPTLYVIKGGKEGANGDPISFFSLIIPPVWAVLYSPYTVGLSIVVLAALFLIVFRTKEFGCEKHEEFLAVILLLLLASPLFLYLLNGTLYVRAKALIPFLPLYVLILAIFLTRFKGFMRNREKFTPRKRKFLVWALFIFLVCDSGLNCVRENLTDQLVPAQEYAEVYNPDKIALDPGSAAGAIPASIVCSIWPTATSHAIRSTAPGIIRRPLYSSTCNKGFNEFYYDVLHNPIATRNRLDCASSNNIFSLNYFNVKYIVTNENAPAGYQKVNEKGEYTLYQNDHAMPFAFASDHTMSQKDFDAIPFPYNMGPLFENIIIDKKGDSLNTDKTPSGFAIRKIDLKSKHLKVENAKNVAIKERNGHFYVHAKDTALKNSDLKENASLDIPLDINLKDDILIVSFQMSNRADQSNEDAFITINGVKNKLSKKSAAYPNDNTEFHLCPFLKMKIRSGSAWNSRRENMRHIISKRIPSLRPSSQKWSAKRIPLSLTRQKREMIRSQGSIHVRSKRLLCNHPPVRQRF